MAKKKITIDDLAGMVQRGFQGVDRRFDLVNERFDAVDHRLDRIERLILADHRRRIERLEGEVKDLKGFMAIK